MGNRNSQTDAAAGELCLDLDPDCRGCGSDQHAPYAEVRAEVIDATRVAWKRTQCRHCGQHRVNRFGAPVPAPTPTPTPPQSRPRAAR